MLSKAWGITMTFIDDMRIAEIETFLGLRNGFNVGQSGITSARLFRRFDTGGC